MDVQAVFIFKQSRNHEKNDVSYYTAGNNNKLMINTESKRTAMRTHLESRTVITMDILYPLYYRYPATRSADS